MLDPHWVFLSAALGLVGSTQYAFAIARGRARPNLVTWSLWATAPLIGFLAQLDAGVGLPAVQTLSAGLGPLIVVVSGLLHKHARARPGPFDVGCGLLSLVTVGVWLGLGQAPLAVLLAVAADATAAAPTIRKAWRDPGSENLPTYVLSAIGSTVTLLTITTWDPASWAFAAYVLLLALSLVGIIVGRQSVSRGPGHVAGDAGRSCR